MKMFFNLSTLLLGSHLSLELITQKLRIISEMLLNN